MKAFIVPVFTGATVAATSLIFYAMFNKVFGTTLFGTIILVQSIASIVQMTIVPQSWLYVLSAAKAEQIGRRYALAIRIEIFAGLLGTVVMLALTFLPIKILMLHRWEAVLIFIGLWASGSSSHQGYLRANFAWKRFSAFVVWPSLCRLILILLVLVLPNNLCIYPNSSPVLIAAAFFCFPDLIRLILSSAIGLIYQPFSFDISEILAALRQIAHNWLFDFGSGIIENADKLLVGWIISPTMLIVYFFARRIGGAATIAIEPLYAELYRRIQHRPPHERPRREAIAFAIGATVAVGAAISLSVAFLLTGFFPTIARYIPQAVATYPGIFIALLLIDSGVCANRWARFLFQDGFGSTFLLIARLSLRAIFGLALLTISHFDVSSGIAYSYFIMFACEFVFMIFALRRPVRDRFSKMAVR
jgi:hypothetical protein